MLQQLKSEIGNLIQDSNNHDQLIGFLQEIRSNITGIKNSMGNVSEFIIAKHLIKNLASDPSISVLCHQPVNIQNKNKSRKSYVDILINQNNVPSIYIEVKDGGVNGTYSANSKAIDLLDRIKASNCGEFMLLVTKQELKKSFQIIADYVANINAQENLIPNLIVNVYSLDDQDFINRFGSFKTDFDLDWKEQFQSRVLDSIKNILI
jgi:hypothetical protein